MPERRGDITIPMEESTFVNIADRPGEEQVQTPLKVVSPFTTFNPDSANFSDFMSGDVNPISNVSTMGITEDDFQKEAMVNPSRIADEDYQGYLKSLDSPFAPLVNKIGMGIMGYKDPFELYKATQATLDDKSMQSRLARDRQLDKERAERKLAEEQRLRDMIQSMLPPAVETVDPTETTAPIADVITPTEPTSPVVESTRVPDFTIPALPTLPATSPLLPPGISPELLRNLFKLQGVPATAMQEGGSVNKLDTAVDNFLSAVRQ